MDKLGPYHFDDIVRIMLDIFPEMELGEDNDGQLIVYTGWEACSSDGFYAPMKQEGQEVPKGLRGTLGNPINITQTYLALTWDKCNFLQYK